MDIIAGASLARRTVNLPISVVKITVVGPGPVCGSRLRAVWKMLHLSPGPMVRIHLPPPVSPRVRALVVARCCCAEQHLRCTVDAIAADRIEDPMRHDFAQQDVTRPAEQPYHRVLGAGGEKLDVRATRPARVYRPERWAGAEPMVRGLSAGGRWIRTFGPP